MKHESKTNFIIDALMFLVMMTMGGIGFLMKFILVPGSKRYEIYGDNVDLFLWGWDRHQWGSVHLILGYILLCLLVLHIFFHWKQIISMFRNLIHKKSHRFVLTIIFIPLSIIFLLFAFFVDFEKVPIKRGEGRRRIELSRPESSESLSVSKADDVSDKSSQKQSKTHSESSVQVDGRMTLHSIATIYRVPADSIKKILGIPRSCSDRENLGQFRRRYNFHMSDVERYIEKYQRENDIKTESTIEYRESEHDRDYKHQNEPIIEIYGSMPLRELENYYQVPADSIKKFLGIPLRISNYENLGRLRRVYGFHMSDVERFIEKYRQMNN